MDLIGIVNYLQNTLGRRNAGFEYDKHGRKKSAALKSSANHSPEDAPSHAGHQHGLGEKVDTSA